MVATLAAAGAAAPPPPADLEQLLAMSKRGGVLSLALGLPAHELFPARAYSDALQRILRDQRALQYGEPTERLKSHVVALMRRRGVTCSEQQVVLTNGAQEGIDLAARLLLTPGATMLVEDRAYFGLKLATERHAPRVLSVPSDLETGMDVDAVAALLAAGERPALIYTISDGHNPLGLSLSLQKRRQLVELARRHHVPIVEDDPYGLISFVPDPLPALRSFDDDWVIYIGTFSKVLAPALRVGWMVVAEKHTARLHRLKESVDLNIATLSQRGASALLDEMDLDAHLDTLRREYGKRRTAIVGAMHEHLPRDARFTTPAAGIFTWVELPPGHDTQQLLARAVERGVAFLPGQAFWVDGGPRPTNGLRLSFATCTPAELDEAVRRLGRVLCA